MPSPVTTRSSLRSLTKRRHHLSQAKACFATRSCHSNGRMRGNVSEARKQDVRSKDWTECRGIRR